MIPRLKPQLGGREIAAALSVPRADDVSRFERAFAELMGQPEAIAFPYGRTGLIVLLEALGIANGEIICPAYTCVVVPHAIVRSGSEPVFVDSRADEFNMDLDLAEAAITPNTRAIVATSLFGYPVDLDRLEQIRSRHPKIAIIQDCAHSFGAEWQGKPVQCAGDAAIFGLNVSKIITSIFGGMVTTESAALAARIREIRDQRLSKPAFVKSLRRLLYLFATIPAFTESGYTWVNRLERSGLLDRFVRYYDENCIDMPGDYLEALTSVEARVGSAQVERYSEIISSRRAVAEWYFDALDDVPGLTLPPRVRGATYSHFVPLVEDRDRVLEAMLHEGVQLGQLIEYSIPSMAAYVNRCGSRGRSFPVADDLSRRTINLPVAAGMGAAERTVAALRKVV